MRFFRGPDMMRFSFLLLLTATIGCREQRQAAGPAPSVAKPDPSPAIYQDEAARLGLDFTYLNGMTGAYYLPEIIGGGGALFDYDQDGDLDIFLVQGEVLEKGKSWLDTVFPPTVAPGDRLFRNDLTAEGGGRFTDVTEASGVNGEGYGMGAAVGDYNGDGFPDLYVTNLGGNRLYHNNGNGTFTDVTKASGADDPRWSVSASFVDIDQDGDLDLFIGNYVNFTVAANIACHAPGPVYCHPLTYEAVPDRLLENLGDGVFRDITVSAGIDQAFGRALGVVAADFNGDGAIDIYVANDASANQLWINRGGGRFEDTALLAGCGLNESGQPEAGMGVDAGDYDGDGDQDLFMTHLKGETNTIYVNDGSGMFEDRTLSLGLGPASLPFTGFGTAWTDYDNDGWLDLLAVNGSVTRLDELNGDPFPYRQTNQLFRNMGDGTFVEVTQKAGPAFRLAEVSRGAMFGDIDNDGDQDALVVNINNEARLLLNQTDSKHGWIGIRAVDPATGGDAIGALVAAFRSDGLVLWRRIHTDAGYASAHDPRVLLGLGNAQLEKIRIVWPGGAQEEWRGLGPNRWHTLKRGAGAAGGPP